MNLYVSAVILIVMLWADVSLSKNAAPKVQIYSREPGHYGESNILICHASGFHPPELNLKMFIDGKEMPNAEQTDLAFEENWYYHLTKYAKFTPEKGHQYSCMVTHLGIEKKYYWEPDN